MTQWPLAVFAVFILSSALPAAQSERVGFADEFDTIAGWNNMNPDSPLAGFEAKDGIGIFKTYVGGLSREIKPNGQAVGVNATSSAIKEYPDEVDLDKYHYVVMKTDEKSAMTLMYINKHEVHVAYSTGVFAEDMAPLGLKGKQKLAIELEIMNCGNPVKIGYIRLVSSLTAEEKAGLIQPPLHLRQEHIAVSDYQGLEALYHRASRPWLANIPEEKVYFRDTGTGARMLRMTGVPGDEGFSEDYEMWESNGASFYVKGSERVFFYEAGQWARPNSKIPAGLRPREKKYRIDSYQKKGAVLFESFDPNTGTTETIYEAPVAKPPGGAVWKNKLVALSEDECIVVNAGEKDPAKMVKKFKPPEGGFKGVSISPDGKFLTGTNPWGSYRKAWLDLETGEVFNGGFFTWTHGMSGTPWSIMSYGSLAKLAINEQANYKGNSKPGNLVRLFGVFDADIHTDYGTMTQDGRYGITNGTDGEVGRQHLMFDRTDAGTILRLCTWRISRIEWNLFTKSIASPDYTKLAVLSDMLGNGNYFFCMTRLPDAPRNATAAKAGHEVALSWEKPERCNEIRGYNIYAADKSGGPFARLNPARVEALTYKDCWPAGLEQRYYLVAAEEFSGVEGYYSGEAAAGDVSGKRVLHFEAEEQEKTLPMREYFDGYASGYKSVRVAKTFPGEDAGSIIFKPGLKTRGDFTLWARVANKDTGAGKISALSAGLAAIIPVSSKQWQWVKAGSKVQLEPQAALVLTSSDDGTAVDKIVLTDDDAFIPQTMDDRKNALSKVSGLHLRQAAASSIELAWLANKEPDVYLYSVYVSEQPDFEIGNATVLCSGEKTAALDWGLKPATKYYYKVTAIDKRGNESEPALIETQTLPLEVVTMELPATKAELAPELKTGRSVDVDYVEFPKGVAAAGGPGGPAINFEFETAKNGRWYFWGEFSPRNTNGRRLGYFVDGKDLGGYDGWRTREPFRLGQNKEIKPGEERWFVQRICGRNGDAADLKAGKHVLTFTFDPKQAGLTPLISKVWITNDASFVAPGFNCQERYNTLRRQPAK